MMTAETMNFSKPLSELLIGLVENNVLINVSGVAIDSRLVNEGNLFMAYRGSVFDGVDKFIKLLVFSFLGLTQLAKTCLLELNFVSIVLFDCLPLQFVLIFQFA